MRNDLQLAFSIRKTATFALLLLACLGLTACGGGISGTGDGSGPIIVIAPESSDSGSIDNVTNSEVGSEVDSEVDSADTGSHSDTATSPSDEVISTSSEGSAPTLSLPTLHSVADYLPNALIAVNTDNTQASSSEPFTQQLILVSGEVSQLQSVLEANGNTIDGIDSNYFDYTRTYSDSEKNSTISWSTDNGLISMFSINSDTMLYVLQDGLTLTVRRFDGANNILFQATLTNSILNDSGVIIEAALNTNGILSYMRTIAASVTTEAAVFTQHPTDISAMQQRELVSALGSITDIQTCTRTNSANSCLSQDDWYVSTGDGSSNAHDKFTAAENIFNSAPELTSLVPYSLPEGVNSAVIASTDNGLTIAEQVQCGMQVVNETVRVFCLQPQPLEAAGNLYQEQLSGGQAFYQLLQ